MSQRMKQNKKQKKKKKKKKKKNDIGAQWRLRCPVWSEPSLFAWRKLGSLATHLAHSEGSDQTERMPSLIWVFAGRTCHFVDFVMLWHMPCLGKAVARTLKHI